MSLEDFRDEIYKCVRCGFCREMVAPETGTYGICPTWEKFGFESYTARGQIAIARALLEGRLEYSERLVERMYTCLVCGNCKAHCEIAGPEVDTNGILLAMRARFVESGCELPSGVSQLHSNLRREYNIFGLPKEERDTWFPEEIRIRDKGEIAYFVGCQSAYRSHEIARATARIMEKALQDFVVLGEQEWCCGLPLILTGAVGIARDFAKHNLERLRQMGIKTIIASCPGCYRTLKVEYPRILGETDLQVLHTSEMFAHLLRERKIEIKDKIDAKVAYHDPCDLGRHSGVYEQPREVIRAIPGIDLVELRRNRVNAWCCGAGGGIMALNADWSVELAVEKLREAEEVCAQLLVSSCQTCKVNIRNAKLTYGSGIEVLDLSEILARAMQIPTDLSF